MSGEVSQEGAVFGATRYVPRVSGPAFYVNAVTGNDANTGTRPSDPFLTIGAALAVATAGSVIVISAGTYDENGLDIAVDGVALLGEIGSILVDTTTGTQTLLISGDSCRVRGLHVAQGAQIGVKVTGESCWLENVICNEAPTVAFDIDGDYTVIRRCSAVLYTTAGFDIAGARCQIEGCNAFGDGSATRGVYLSAAGADYNLFIDVSTAGNATAGYETIATATNNTFRGCISGGADGPRVDAGTENTWSGFNYDTPTEKVTTVTADLSYNLFKITGIVDIVKIYGVVETVLAADVTAACLQLFPTGGAAIQLSSVGGVDISSAPVGSLILKQNVLAQALTLKSSALGFAVENAATWEFQRVTVGQKASTETHVRFTRAGAGASGVIRWYVEWEPVSKDGFLEVV